MVLETSPVAPMLIALLIPIVYCIKWKKECLQKIGIISICLVLIVIFYPIISYLGKYIDSSLAYFFGKLLLFTILPLAVILYLEKWKIKDALSLLGLQKKNVGKSILLGLGVLAITAAIALVFYWGTKGHLSISWNTIMFFDAFNEEFLFRGVLLLYIWKITDIKIAYMTSISAFILAHSQYYSPTFMLGSLIGTIAQGLLLGIVTYKTKNIVGPWISHGLNRVMVQVIRALLF